MLIILKFYIVNVTTYKYRIWVDMLWNMLEYRTILVDFYNPENIKSWKRPYVKSHMKVSFELQCLMCDVMGSHEVALSNETTHILNPELYYLNIKMKM